MRIIFVTILSLFLAITGSISCLAQDKKNGSLLISGAVEPLFLFKNALKMDIELQQKEKSLAWVISPELYVGGSYDGGFLKSYDGDKISGFGIGLLQKFKFRKTVSGPYFACGATYRNINIKYSDVGFYSYRSDDLQYYEYGNFSDRLKINSILMNAIIGAQEISTGGFLFDAYLGLGYKTSDKKSNMEGYRKYDQAPASYAYNGFIPVFGMKFGYRF